MLTRLLIVLLAILNVGVALWWLAPRAEPVAVVAPTELSTLSVRIFPDVHHCRTTGRRSAARIYRRFRISDNLDPSGIRTRLDRRLVDNRLAPYQPFEQNRQPAEDVARSSAQ